MRKIFTFSRLAALLLTAMMTLPQMVMAQQPAPFFWKDGVYSLTLCVGQTLDANTLVNNYSDLPVTWSSSNENYFTVDENGIITPLQETSESPAKLYAHTDAITIGSTSYSEKNLELEVLISYPLILFPWTSKEIKVTPENANDILGNGKLSYNYSTHTLTMNNWGVVDFETQFSPADDDDLNGGFTYQDQSTPLTVNLVGTNTISNCNDLFSSPNLINLIFTGSGSLTVNSDVMVISVMNQLTIDGASLTLNMATDDLTTTQTNYGVFYADKLAVVNGGHFHATVSTNANLSQCGSCYMVGKVTSSLEGNILTEHVIWSNDPANESDISDYYQTNPDDYVGCFFDDRGGAMLAREVEIGSDAQQSTKEDIDMYFQDYDYNTDQNVRISEFEMIMDETGYSESHTIEFKWSLPGVPDVTFASSDDQSLEVYAQADTEGNDRYVVSFYPHSHGTFTVTATFAGDAQYNQAIATLDVSVINGRYSFAKDLVFKKQSDPSSPYNPYDVIVDHLEMTEGATVKLPELCHRYQTYPASHTLIPSQSTARGHFFAPWADPSCQNVGCDVDAEHITAVAAGRDTLVVKYHFYSDEPLETVKLPIRILPLVQPVTNNSATSFDFGYTTPGANAELIFQTTANDKVNDGKLEISTTLNPSQVETFIDRNAAGTQAWLDNLHGALTLNLPAGQGTLSIECYADPGVEFKLKIRGKAAVTIAQTSMGTAKVNFDLEEPTAVIIYLTGAGGYSPAPKRAPAAKAESAKGYIKSISIAPRADIAAKQDPENAGVFYSTFFDSARKFALPNDGTKAFVAKIEGTDMAMTPIADGDQIIPANTAVILQSPTGSFSLTPSEGSAVTVNPEDNQLQGVDEATAAQPNCYVLSGHSTDNSVTGVGFYAFSGTIPAHKAYLINGGASAPKRMRFIFNEEQQATGIDNAAEALKSEKRIENGQLIIIKNGVRYNAQGQVVK